jgi:hypothetical protein
MRRICFLCIWLLCLIACRQEEGEEKPVASKSSREVYNINTLADTVMVNAVLRQGNNTVKSATDSAIEFYLRAIDLSDQIGYMEGRRSLTIIWRSAITSRETSHGGTPIWIS